MNQFYKNLISVITFVIAFTIAASAQYTIQDSDVTVENGIITQCNTASSDWGTGELNIPAVLDGQNVKGISYNVFSSKGITKLTLAEGIEEIKAYSFGSNPIIEIHFPASLLKINAGVFEHCSLTKITLPVNIEYIGSSAFGYNSIDSVVIPQSVAYLGKSIFQHNNVKHVEFEENSNIRLIDENCFQDGGYSSLTSVTLPTNMNPGFTAYRDLQGNVYNEGNSITDFSGIYFADIPPHILTTKDVQFNNDQIIDYSGSYPKIIIPHEIDGIAINTIPGASFDYRTIIEVNFSEGITSIDFNAFAYCHIKKITLPNSLVSLGSGAFMNNLIDTLQLPENLNSVGGNAFQYNVLKYVRIPGSLTHLESCVFQNNLLDSIYIPETVISIGSCAFADNQLSGIFLNNTINSVGTFAFSNNLINRVTLSENMTNLSIGVFENNKLDSLILPAGILSIDDRAFNGNSLRNIILPDHINFIGKKAFAGNVGLASVELPDVTRDGYTFINWQNNSDSSSVTRILDFDASYEALFTINSYDVIFTSGGNGILAGDTIQVVEYGNDATGVHAIPNQGYHFQKWQNSITGDSVSASNPLVIYNVNKDTALEAVFVKDITTLTGDQEISLVLYPNPVIHTLNIKSQVKIRSVEIINGNGSIICRNDVNQTQVSLSMKNVAPGIYFVKVGVENSFIIRKVVVE
ncbi:MAG TPA: leucine-rich repeat protein [Bacteroidales bacterium]|nr:leucine-rich repeat protein [Bacteroidales bacterium]